LIATSYTQRKILESLFLRSFAGIEERYLGSRPALNAEKRIS